MNAEPSTDYGVSDKLIVSPAELTIQRGKTADVTIIGGSGEYTTLDGKETVARSVAISYDHTSMVKRGLLTILGVSAGDAYITVMDKQDASSYVIHVTVEDPDSAPLQLSSTDITVDLYTSNAVQITSGNGSYSVASDKPSVANASVYGSTIAIEANGPGTAIITVTDTQSGQQATIKVNVVDHSLPKLTLSSNTISLMVGYEGSVWIMSGTGNYTVSCDNTAIATCYIEDSYVKINPLAKGECTITVTDTNSGASVAIDVEVIPYEEITDCTDYIQNAGFDEDLTWQPNGTTKADVYQAETLSERSIAWLAADGSRYAKVNPSTPKSRSDGKTFYATNGFIGTIKGWETVPSAALQNNNLCEWVYFGSIPYALKADALPISDDGDSYLTTPVKPGAFNGSDNIGALHLRAGWGNQCTYRQVVNLPAAKYRLEYYIRNTNVARSRNLSGVKNLCSVTCNGQVFVDDEGFNSEGWTLHSIDFEPTESFTIEFGFKSANTLSTDNPQLWIDCIKLYKVEDSQP
jgi:hypothetical protein